MPSKSSAANNAKRSPYSMRQVIANNIRKRRLALGWSQQKLADEFGVSRAAISQYEIGKGEVNAGDLPHLAEILGITLLEFYIGELEACFELSGAVPWILEVARGCLESHGFLDSNQQNTSVKEIVSPMALEPKGTGGLFLLDDWLEFAYELRIAGKTECDLSSVLQLVELAEHFLSLSSQDQETLLRVAQALQEKPAVTSKTERAEVSG